MRPNIRSETLHRLYVELEELHNNQDYPYRDRLGAFMERLFHGLASGLPDGAREKILLEAKNGTIWAITSEVWDSPEKHHIYQAMVYRGHTVWSNITREKWLALICLYGPATHLRALGAAVMRKYKLKAISDIRGLIVNTPISDNDLPRLLVSPYNPLFHLHSNDVLTDVYNLSAIFCGKWYPDGRLWEDSWGGTSADLERLARYGTDTKKIKELEDMRASSF